MKTYQAFAKTNYQNPLTLTEIKALNIKDAVKWFQINTVEYETVEIKK